MKAVYGSVLVVGLLAGGAAFAVPLEQECVEVSQAWGSTGDVAVQCACIAQAAEADEALMAEFRSFKDAYSSDAEAYDGASDAAREVMDSCAVET